MRRPVGKTRIVSYSLDKLPRNLYVQCIRLNFHERGSMQYRLNRHYNIFKASDDFAVCLIDSEGWLLAWSLVFTAKEICPIQGYREPIGTQHAYYYVRRSHRENGYGKRLAKVVNRRWPNVQVHPWGPVSRAFFAETGKVVDYRLYPGQRFPQDRTTRAWG